MNMKFPNQNAKAEGATGLNKKMEDEMKIKESGGVMIYETKRGFISLNVFKLEKFIIGDIFKTENGKLSLFPAPTSNCPLCQ